jgi:hypothetical protein
MVNVGVVRFEYKFSIVEMTTYMLTKAIPRPKNILGICTFLVCNLHKIDHLVGMLTKLSNQSIFELIEDHFSFNVDL